MKPYAGIGSRQTPQEILNFMQLVANKLDSQGFILRSGGAGGADSYFEMGAKHKEIYLPWDGFNNRFRGDGCFVLNDLSPNLYREVGQIAKKYHPYWDTMGRGAKALHARNVLQVLGKDLQTPAKFIVCWTPGASGSGGTGQAIRIAKAHNVKVFDLADEESYEVINKWLTK